MKEGNCSVVAALMALDCLGSGGARGLEWKMEFTKTD